MVLCDTGKIKRAVLVGTSWSWVRAFAFAFVLGLLCLWWVGEGRLFGASANFFYKIGRNSEMKNWSQCAKWSASPRATNGPLTKFGVPGQKTDFRAKSGFLAQKKLTFYSSHGQATTGKSCANKTVPFSEINNSLSVFFGKKNGFLAKKNTFRPNVKTVVSP